MNQTVVAGASSGIGRAAKLVAWLDSHRASFVTGANYPVHGGYLAR